MTKPLEFFVPQNAECRMSIRVDVRIPVTIVFPPLVGHQSVRAVTRNVSFDGAFIELRYPSLQKGDRVRVVLEIADKEPIIAYALVVRRTSHGLALMFTIYDNEILDSLSAILAAEFNKYIDCRSGLRTVVNSNPLQS